MHKSVYPQQGQPLLPDILKPLVGDKYVSCPWLGGEIVSLGKVDQLSLTEAQRVAIAPAIVNKVQLMMRSRRLTPALKKTRISVPQHIQPSQLEMDDRALFFFRARKFFDADAKWRSASIEMLCGLHTIGAKYLIAFLLAVEQLRTHKPDADKSEKHLFLEDELASATHGAVLAKRASEVFLVASGWNGDGPKKLEDVAKAAHVTRERIRQLVKDASTALIGAVSRLPSRNLRRAVSVVEAMAPCLAEDASKKLLAQRISRSRFDISGLLHAAELYRIKHSLQLFTVSGQRVVMSAEHKAYIELAQAIARKAGSRIGIVSVALLREEIERLGKESVRGRGHRLLCGLQPHAVNRLAKCAPINLLAISLMPDISWLDRKLGWFWFPDLKKRNGALSRIRKVVAYSKEVDMAAVQGALQAFTPSAAPLPTRVPKRVLAQFCREAGFDVDEEVVRITDRAGARIKSIEEKMADVLMAAGGELRKAKFAKLCVDAKIKIHTFFVYLKTSPLFYVTSTGKIAVRGTSRALALKRAA